jgi:GDP/UDP-N,N'-diacetylbacillosamine 2-epimerase (hydrolysing)
LEKLYPTRVRLVEALGKLNYFSAIKHCQLMLGNTSSGIVEAASFNKWVVNVGERQKGRLKNKNVLDAPFDEGKILTTLNVININAKYDGTNIYYKKDSVSKILKEIKKLTAI